jgi:uncharacterized protein
MQRVFVQRAIAAFFALAVPQLAQAASFDCSRAVTSIEHAICGRQDLNELDSRLGEVFRKALSLQADHGPLLRDQRAWLSKRDKTCGSLGVGVQERCLLKQFNGRIATLSSIVSQVGALAHQSPDVHLADQTSIIRMEKEGGVYVVPVRFNDMITLSAIVDSGASDVSVPADVVLTLMRTKTITDQDFLGEKTYVLADGSNLPSQQFRIRSLKVGDKTIENVVAGIASAKGDILLGQSFLSKFKSWSFDNEQHTLVLR